MSRGAFPNNCGVLVGCGGGGAPAVTGRWFWGQRVCACPAGGLGLVSAGRDAGRRAAELRSSERCLHSPGFGGKQLVRAAAERTRVAILYRKRVCIP